MSAERILKEHLMAATDLGIDVTEIKEPSKALMGEAYKQLEAAVNYFISKGSIVADDCRGIIVHPSGKYVTIFGKIQRGDEYNGFSFHIEEARKKFVVFHYDYNDFVSFHYDSNGLDYWQNYS
jgi:hypothetical protein